jgi:hypothetical protein
LGFIEFLRRADKMSNLERKIVEKLVSDADAKALLEWSLRFEQASGKF